MNEAPPKLRRSDVNKISEIQLATWLSRNREPGALPCIPIILINSLTGDKAGLTMNFKEGMKMDDILKFLNAAAEQVKLKIEEGN